MIHFVNIPPTVSVYAILNYVKIFISRIFLKQLIVKMLSHEKECEDCWMMKLEDSTLRLKFKNAVFNVLENILASGYGKFVPERNVQIIFNSVLMIIGRFIVCYMLSKALYM